MPAESKLYNNRLEPAVCSMAEARRDERTGLGSGNFREKKSKTSSKTTQSRFFLRNSEEFAQEVNSRPFSPCSFRCCGPTVAESETTVRRCRPLVTAD